VQCQSIFQSVEVGIFELPRWSNDVDTGRDRTLIAAKPVFVSGVGIRRRHCHFLPIGNRRRLQTSMGHV
jgi:hypothetical protein